MSDDTARQFPTLWIAASGEAIIREEQFWTEAIACFHALQKAQAQLAAAEQALAWVMRSHVPNLAIIPSEHTQAINRALDATREEKP